MKVDNTRLDAIRSLVKKLKTEKVESTQGVDGAGATDGTTGPQGTGSTGEVSAAGYGELHHTVEEKQLARDVQLVLEATDPARQARLDSLKAQIDAGEYKVEPEALADRLAATGLFDEA